MIKADLCCPWFIFYVVSLHPSKGSLNIATELHSWELLINRKWKKTVFGRVNRHGNTTTSWPHWLNEWISSAFSALLGCTIDVALEGQGGEWWGAKANRNSCSHPEESCKPTATGKSLPIRSTGLPNAHSHIWGVHTLSVCNPGRTLIPWSIKYVFMPTLNTSNAFTACLEQRTPSASISVVNDQPLIL